MSQTTLISDLQSDGQELNSVLVIIKDRKNLSETITDLSLPLETRINSVKIFFDKFGQEESNELIKRLSMMYQFSGTKILEKYLYEICTNCPISAFLKLVSAKSLCYFNRDNEIGYEALDFICKDSNSMKTVATPCQIESVCLLMCHKLYKNQANTYFCNIINNPNIDCDYRYKTILSLENKEVPDLSFFLYEAASSFFYNNNNRTMYRILAGQYIMQKCTLSIMEKGKVELVILSFAQDPDLDYNLRADSADVILKLGSKDNKKTAKTIIMMLGRQDGDVKTIFDNAQNVHVDEIEQSVLEALEFLSSIEMNTITGVPGTEKISFEYVKKKLDDILKESKPKKIKKTSKKYKEYKEKEDKIKISLNRIYMDRALYSKYNCSLIHILLKIWTYLTTHDACQVMKTRLIEELIDMAGTCSSGFASRLVNVISGFGDFNLTISWRDQIIANFTGRLNARARDITDEHEIMKHCKLYNMYSQVCEICGCCTKDKVIPDTKHKKIIKILLEEFQGHVLEEMTVNSTEYESRKNFLKFFRKNMLNIRQELYEEFKSHITDTDFDLYFRSAISTYETGGYV